MSRKPAIAAPPAVTMRQALSDPALLGKVLAGDSWRAWRVLLIAAMGEALDDEERAIFQRLTGRPQEPGERLEEFWAVVGRRGGKSRAIAVLCVFIAVFIDHSPVLVIGERPVVLCLAPSQKQAGIVFGYIAGILETTPLLSKLITNKTTEILSLSNQVEIEVRSASFRNVRGVTAVAVVGDEAAFWYDEASGSANPDSAILDALRPALATTGGLLAVISSPYARRGAVYETWSRHHGEKGDPRILVAQGASRDFNPSLPQKVVDRAMERDPVAASAEYGGRWRDDVLIFISRELVESAVDAGVVARPPRPGISYIGYVDSASGAGKDSFCVAIGHREGDDIMLDAISEQRPPFNPQSAARDAAALLKTYKISHCTGDKYAAGFTIEAFGRNAIEYRYCPNDTSTNYLESLPQLTAGRVRLLDNRRLIEQFCGLERKTSPSGRDRVDHGGADRHDDVSAAVAGLIATLASARPPMRINPEAIRRMSQPLSGYPPLQANMTWRN